jgi:hypothetical protein
MSVEARVINGWTKQISLGSVAKTATGQEPLVRDADPVRRCAPPAMSRPVQVTFDLGDPPSCRAASKPFSAKQPDPT